MARGFKDLTGEKMFNWVVLKRVENNKDGKAQWLCECQCENKTKEILLTSQLNGKKKSCGCLRQKMRVESLRSFYENEYIFTEEECLIVANNTKNKFSIDIEDYKKVKSYSWYETKRGYLATTINRKTIFLHRLVLGLENTNEGTVDHIFHTKEGYNSFKNNHKSNLRITTQNKNGINKKVSIRNTSGKSGVYLDKRYGKWKAYITYQYKRYNLGSYETFEEAVEAREEAERKYFKEFNYKEENK